MPLAYESFLNSPHPIDKHQNYFAIYDLLLSSYQNKQITFVEVGILDGGSLFMWRDFFGPEARIIGVDLNPAATKWVSHGFEIFIGDQGQDSFWKSFYLQVGKIDVLLDDGGHTNNQQITTVINSIPAIKDGGLILIEDTHASYVREFGNPSKSSFQEFCKKGTDAIQSRSPDVRIRGTVFSRTVWSIGFFESISAFYIDRNSCLENSGVSNFNTSLQAEREKDFRYVSDARWLGLVKIAQKIFSLEYKSIGGTRTYLRPFNFLFINSWIRKILRFTFFPLKAICDIIIEIELQNQFHKLQKRSKQYFSGR